MAGKRNGKTPANRLARRVKELGEAMKRLRKAEKLARRAAAATARQFPKELARPK